jgi:GntR family transcriptional regulator
VTAGSDMISLGRGPGSVAMPAASKTQRLIEYLLGEIQAGRLQPGDPIPSAAKLREQHDVSITVVREAVNYLKATGVLVGVPGVAVFVAERTIPNG